MLATPGVQTVVDTALAAQGQIINFNCGLRTRSIRLGVHDYLERLEAANLTMGDIAQDIAQATGDKAVSERSVPVAEQPPLKRQRLLDGLDLFLGVADAAFQQRLVAFTEACVQRPALSFEGVFGLHALHALCSTVGWTLCMLTCCPAESLTRSVCDERYRVFDDELDRPS